MCEESNWALLLQNIYKKEKEKKSDRGDWFPLQKYHEDEGIDKPIIGVHVNGGGRLRKYPTLL